MATPAPHIYGSQNASIFYNDRGEWEIHHTCSDQSGLVTDEKLKGMDLTALMRLQGQLEADVDTFAPEALFEYYRDVTRAAKAGLIVDSVVLRIVKNEIEQRKEHDLTKVDGAYS